jgi:hypothetical protein
VKILITGSRAWTNKKLIEEILSEYADSRGAASITVVHGACPTGADAMADEIALQLGMTIQRYPADWTTHGKAAGPIRNQHMVDQGADVCLAFFLPNSRGTVHCANAAEEAGIPTWRYHADD